MEGSALSAPRTLVLDFQAEGVERQIHVTDKGGHRSDQSELTDAEQADDQPPRFPRHQGGEEEDQNQDQSRGAPHRRRIVMKAMKVEEIRKLGAEEIRTKLADARDEMMKLRFQQVTGQLTDSSRLTILRRDIARMETILRETERAAVVEGAK